jgi:hypothetical protein
MLFALGAFEVGDKRLQEFPDKTGKPPKNWQIPPEQLPPHPLATMMLHRRRGYAVASALAVLTTLVAAPRPGAAESTVDSLARIGAWIQPFEKGGAAVPRCHANREGGLGERPAALQAVGETSKRSPSDRHHLQGGPGIVPARRRARRLAPTLGL